MIKFGQIWLNLLKIYMKKANNWPKWPQNSQINKNCKLNNKKLVLNGQYEFEFSRI
jgi:hypothetical protein